MASREACGDSPYPLGGVKGEIGGGGGVGGGEGKSGMVDDPFVAIVVAVIRLVDRCLPRL